MGAIATDPTNTEPFARLLHAASRRPLIRREITPDMIPEGWDVQRTWAALMRVRGAQGFFTPYLVLTDTHHPECITVPASLQASLARIGSITQHGSRLDTLVGAYQDCRFITQQYIDEILTNLRLDGFPTDHETVRAVLVGEREPLGTAETITHNFHEIMNALGDYEGQAVSPALIRGMYDRLNVGIPRNVAPIVDPTYPVNNYHDEFGMGANPSLDRLLDVESQLARGELTEAEMHPILLSMLVNCFFWRFSPFPRLNNFMGCIVSRLFLYQHGFPAFRYVPKAWLYTEWARGNVADVIPYRFDEAVAAGDDFDDYTALYDSIMRLMLMSVESMAADLERRDHADHAAIAAIDAVPWLNMRQRQILREAIIKPDTTFHIKAHERRFGIANSTSRKDLADLRERGFLTLGYESSAYVYRASPNLRELLLAGTTAGRQAAGRA
ncbi:hypothetical protein I3I95_10205 [bacterium]|nr:hypothetical protein [bacterium]